MYYRLQLGGRAAWQQTLCEFVPLLLHLFRKAGGASEDGRISVKGFFGTLEAGSLLDSRLSVARASEIFMQANYEDEDLRSWRDWDWEMELHEFAEAIARVAVVRSGQAVATVGTAEIVEAVHALMHDELVENLCRSNALDTPTAQVGPIGYECMGCAC